MNPVESQAGMTEDSSNFAEDEATIVQATRVEDVVVDATVATPHGTPCPACGCPLESDDRFCPACGTANTTFQGPAARSPEDTASDPPQKHFRCQNCGSEITADVDQRSYTCPFCDSAYVVEFSPETSERQRPEFVIGFTVPPEAALDKFRAWLKDNSWFRPGDLKQATVAEKLLGVYLPFWSFSMLAESDWAAHIGEYWYRTETYTTTDSKGKTVTRTRRVRETEWWPLRGRFHRYHRGYLVSGSQRISQAEADSIKPFQLPALKRYEPFYLAGWLSEEYSVERDAALEVCRVEFHRRQEGLIRAFLPGDTHRGLQLSTQFSQEQSDLCLLPLYLMTYHYRDRQFRFMVNGQTGRVAGQKPISAKRIGAAIGIGCTILAAIVLLIWWLSR